MGFRLYPSSLITSLTLAIDPQPNSEPGSDLIALPGASDSVISLSQADIAGNGLTGLDNVSAPGDPSPTSLTTLFIRIVMSGAIPLLADNQPTVAIKIADGAPKVVTTNSAPISLYDKPDFDPTRTQIADAIWYAPDPNNTYSIKVFVYVASGLWTIKLKNRDAAVRQFTWAIAGSLKDSRQPWMDVSTPVLTYEAQTHDSVSQPLTVANYGTGAFEITSLDPPLRSTFAPPPVLPVTVYLNHSQTVQITFKAPGTPPAPDGKTSTSTTVVTTPIDTKATTTAGHNKQVVINTTTISANLIAATQLTNKTSLLVGGAFRSLVQTNPVIGALHGQRRGASLRDLSYFLPPVIESCRQGSTHPFDQFFPGMKSTYTALGIPTSWLKGFYQYIRNHHGLTHDVAIVANTHLDYAINAVT